MMISDKLNEIDKITNSFKNEFGSLNEASLNWKPSLSEWSIAQNIHHLIVINNTYFPLIQNLREGNLTLPYSSRFNFIVNLFGKFILKSFDDNRKNKRKTFKIWEPAESNIDLEIIENFVQHQIKLKDIILNCQDLVAKEAIIHSPANKNIIYKLETAFNIIIAHEKRHLEQSREVFNLMNSTTKK